MPAPPNSSAIVAAVGLLTSTICSLGVLALNVRNWAGSEEFALQIARTKPTISIFVQLVSHILGLLQVSSLYPNAEYPGTVIALSFRQYASTSGFSLNLLRLVNFANSLRFSWDLPWGHSLLLVFFIALSTVPGAVWSGAITPLVVPHNITADYSIPLIRAVNLSENSLFNPEAGNADGYAGHCINIRDSGGDTSNSSPRGSFHYCINSLRPAMLYSASLSSTKTRFSDVGSEVSVGHTKLDMSGYSYSGRSYGAGGSVGIANLAGVADPRYFVFREPGIRTTVSCSKNPSSRFAFSCRPSTGGTTCQANTIRTLPEGRSALSGPTFGGNWTKSAPLAGDIMTWGSAYENRTTWFSLAAAGCSDVGSNCDLYGFAEFDKAQCLLSFEGAELEVGVNVTSRMITVTPVAKADWPSYSDDLLEELAAEHNYISYNDGTWSGSQMGHALRSNLDSFEVLRRQLTNAAKDETTVLQSLEDFFGDLMDNSLIAYAQSKYLAEHSEQVVQATVTRYSVVFGQARYIYAIFAINAVFVLLFIVEACRTRGWRYMCNMELHDIASVAVGASAGGRGLASYVKMHNAQALENGEDSRSGVSAAAGETRLRVETANGGTSALVLEEYVMDVFGNDKIVDRSSETVYVEAGRSLMKSSHIRRSAEQR